MKHNRRRRPGKPRVSPSVLERINPNVAGIDCGSAEHFVAVPPDRDPTPVRSFPTFTSDLHRLADWLTTCRVTSVVTVPLAAPATPLPPPRVTKKPRDNEPRFEIRTPLHQLTGGVDLTQIDGITPYTALKLLSEIGTDMGRWPSEKHFTSWLTLAPKNKISGGRLLSSRTQPSANRAAAILLMTAMCLGRTQTALGAFYRRLDRQAAGHHRHRAEARHPDLSSAQRRTRLS